jgi:exosortase/archaeosortase
VHTGVGVGVGATGVCVATITLAPGGNIDAIVARNESTVALTSAASAAVAVMVIMYSTTEPLDERIMKF